MKVIINDEEYEVPDLLIEKFTKEFEGLPGKGYHQEVGLLRDSVMTVLEVGLEDPELLDEPEYLYDFTKALAMKKALEKHGIFYDA
jgi:hypothetical protein